MNPSTPHRFKLHFMMSVPSTARQWVVNDAKNGFDGLELQQSVEVPQPGDYEVLVAMKAVSLNYRDLIIPQVRLPLRRLCIILTKTGQIPISNGYAGCAMLRWCWQGCQSRIQSDRIHRGR